MDQPEFLTVKEVAGKLRVSLDCVYDLFAGGKLPGVRLGRGIRLSRSGFEAFLKQERTVPPPVVSRRVAVSPARRRSPVPLPASGPRFLRG